MIETARRQTLRKYERLHDKTTLDLVFSVGKSINSPPVKLLWTIYKKESKVPVKAGFSVPKKLMRKAVTRNLLKRRMREAYRKNKIMKTTPGKTYAMMFIYVSPKINSYAEIESKIVVTLQQFKAVTGAE